MNSLRSSCFSGFSCHLSRTLGREGAVRSKYSSLSKSYFLLVSIKVRVCNAYEEIWWDRLIVFSRWIFLRWKTMLIFTGQFSSWDVNIRYLKLWNIFSDIKVEHEISFHSYFTSIYFSISSTIMDIFLNIMPSIYHYVIIFLYHNYVTLSLKYNFIIYVSHNSEYIFLIHFIYLN